MNIVKITEKQQAACGTIAEINQVILSFNSESFKYKTSIVGKTPDSLTNAKVVIPLKNT